jgi:hypothetical protein
MNIFDPSAEFTLSRAEGPRTGFGLDKRERDKDTEVERHEPRG